MALTAGVCAHSTRCMACSWALLRGMSSEDICAASSWVVCSILQTGCHGSDGGSVAAYCRGFKLGKSLEKEKGGCGGAGPLCVVQQTLWGVNICPTVPPIERTDWEH